MFPRDWRAPGSSQRHIRKDTTQQTPVRGLTCQSRCKVRFESGEARRTSDANHCMQPFEVLMQPADRASSDLTSQFHARGTADRNRNCHHTQCFLDTFAVSYIDEGKGADGVEVGAGCRASTSARHSMRQETCQMTNPRQKMCVRGKCARIICNTIASAARGS